MKESRTEAVLNKYEARLKKYYSPIVENQLYL
jgi:hypothetical protein